MKGEKIGGVGVWWCVVEKGRQPTTIEQRGSGLKKKEKKQSPFSTPFSIVCGREIPGEEKKEKKGEESHLPLRSSTKKNQKREKRGR